jgi:protein ImuA
VSGEPTTELPPTLSTAVNAGRLWQGTRGARHVQPPLATGHQRLDEALGGGWPTGCLLEFLLPRSGADASAGNSIASRITSSAGELPLLLPALAELTAAGRPVLLIAPPHVPYAPGLARAGLVISRLVVVLPPGSARDSRQDARNILWTMEEALASDTCGAVLAWAGEVGQAALRRLHLAAGRGGVLAVLIRSPGSRAGRSPAALRLRLHREPSGGLLLEFLRNRHGPAGTLRLDLARPAFP